MIQRSIKKPLLLIFPFNVLAHYLRCLKLANHLQPYFEIRFLQSAKYCSFINAGGYETFDCNTFDADNVQACIRKFDFSWLNKNDLEKIYLNQLAVIEEMRPLVILGDTMPTLKMATEKTGVKYISLLNGYISRHHADVHQMPASHPFYKYCKLLPSRVLDFLVEKGEQMSFKEIHQPFRELRNKYKLSGKHSYEDEMEGDINLLCDLPELFPQKILPAGYYHIPPLFYEEAEAKDDVAEKLDKSKKTLFASMGSTGDWSKVSFLNHSYFERYNIITAGDTTHVVNTPNVINRSFVNIHSLFPFVDLVICHGGNGTVYQALLFSIPLLCKTAHFEQQWNVHKLETLQLGKSLDAIDAMEDYVMIVEQWIGRKKSNNFGLIENQIRKAISSFPLIIDEIMKNEFYEKQGIPTHSIEETKQIA